MNLYNISLIIIIIIINVCNGHVRLFNTPAALWIRNSATKTGDGEFSVAGPCGGTETWNLARANSFVAGNTLCARISYNGGHADPANAFQAVFACGKPTGTIMRTATQLPLVAGTTPDPTGNTVGAAAVLATGYTLCAVIPKQGLSDAIPLEDPTRQCTLSIKDQRNWGGCLDLILSNDDGTLPAGAPATTPPTVPKASTQVNGLAADTGLLIAKLDEGAYKNIGFGCADSGGDCCPDAYVALKGDSRYASVRLISNSNTCNNIFYATKGGGQGMNYQVTLRPSLTDPATTLVGDFIVDVGGLDSTNQPWGTQIYQLTVREAKANGITVTNIGLSAPKIKDFTATYDKTLLAATQQQLVQYPAGPMGDSIVIIGIIVGVIVLYIFGGIAYNKITKKEWSHPHTVYFALCLQSFMGLFMKNGGNNGNQIQSKDVSEMPLSSKGGKTPLPAGWKEAKDESGDSYYYNTAKNITQWERPVA